MPSYHTYFQPPFNHYYQLLTIMAFSPRSTRIRASPSSDVSRLSYLETIIIDQDWPARLGIISQIELAQMLPELVRQGIVFEWHGVLLIFCFDVMFSFDVYFVPIWNVSLLDDRSEYRFRCHVAWCQPPLRYRNTWRSHKMPHFYCIATQLEADYTLFINLFFFLENEKWKSLQNSLCSRFHPSYGNETGSEGCVIHLGIINCNEVFSRLMPSLGTWICKKQFTTQFFSSLFQTLVT